MTEEEQNAELHEEALKNWKKCEDFHSDLYIQGREDQDFLYGQNQWDASALAYNEHYKLPSLTLNQMLPFAHQVINDIKQTRPAVRVTPFDDKADVDTADILQGLIRNIERQSNANDAYDMAVMNSVGSGYGWIRIGTKYCNAMSFDQDPYIERVPNFQSVYLDPMSLTLAGQDADYAFVFDRIKLEEFEELYPDADTTGFDDGVGDYDWFDDNSVRIAEYYYKVKDLRTIYQVTGTVNGKELSAVVTKEEYNLLEEEGAQLEIVEEREAEFESIKYCKMTGNEILEKTDWVGNHIPIVPVYGEEVFIEGRRESHSLIRQAKDAQKMYNYWKSTITELYALQPKTPWVGAAGAFDSYPDKWRDANTENFAFLEYDPVKDDDTGQMLPPPQRQPSPQISPALMQEAESARNDIRLGLGIFEAGLGQQGNEVSGVAIRNRQIKGENSTFHFMDNLSASITQVGVILVDLIPKLYSKRKIARILGEDSTEEIVPINQSFKKDEDTGKPRPLEQGEKADGIYDLNVGRYDVVCDVGKSYSSRSQEQADALIELTKAAPELMGVIGDKIITSLDVPDAKEIADRLRAQMPPEMLSDDPQAAKLKAAAKEIQGMQEQMKNMEAALLDKSKNEEADQQYKNAQLTIDAKKTESDIKKTNADIAKIMSEISKGDASQEAIKMLTKDVQEIAATVDLMLDDVAEDLQETSEPETEDMQAIESE